ncbi:MAG: hypothetical protein A3G76_07270 [Acidobacteria bacterium RIFCSPLOWO2_12_FULL_65_11]|nr:MAG: hypothetical protein A3H95_05260 [Acidobacteria bacterium RIFCSPLOWO2_02_FULL_64_15]OFW28884.1 MAG: hypothetical protein A3G76_07270 [Acidobacteria bacterium RIFCSPLOWO2_12_FULL_65_11]
MTAWATEPRTDLTTPDKQGFTLASTLAVFIWALTNVPAQAITMSFMTFALAQIFHLGNARSDRTVLLPVRALANPYAIGAVVSVALQVGPTELAPLARLLHVVPLGVREWGVVLALSSVTTLAGQAIRLVQRHCSDWRAVIRLSGQDDRGVPVHAAEAWWA